MDRRTTERSISDSLGNFSWIQKAALQLYRRNVPLLHTSRYVTAHDSCSFTRPSPALILQATNTGVRRLGYEANNHAYSGFHYPYTRSENAGVSVFSIGNKCTYKSTVYVDKIKLRTSQSVLNGTCINVMYVMGVHCLGLVCYKSTE